MQMDETKKHQLALPKVSVIIVNYNYARFLDTAYECVRAQTYPNIEIVIVDDKSMDDSRSKIEAICARDDRVKPVLLEDNGGQVKASLRGLEVAEGAYIIYLDADDQLLPDCVEAHVYCHLSSRLPVALTSVDQINNVNGQDVTMSSAGFTQYVEAGLGKRARAVRPVHESMPASWFGERRPVIGVEQMHFIVPPQVESWAWSATSAICYRREALALLLREPGLETLRSSDGYLVRPLSALFGSILIDVPLMRYVNHSGNRFAQGGPLYNFLAFDLNFEKQNMRTTTAFAVRRLMADVETGGFRYLDPFAFFDTMKALCECWPGMEDVAEQAFYDSQLIENKAALIQGFGAKVVGEEFGRRNLKLDAGAPTKPRGFLKLML